MPRIDQDIARVAEEFPDSITRLRFDECIAGAAIIEASAYFALCDGTLQIVPLDGENVKEVQVHSGAILQSAYCEKSKRIVTGGEDGKVIVTYADGRTELLADTGGRWVDSVAIAPWGAIAYSVGKEAHVLWPDGRSRTIALPSTSESLDFSQTGRKIAIARYEGILLVDLAIPDSAPEALNWPGSHHLVSISPSVKYIVTAMQENMLHGWRLADRKEMRMPGYPTKTRSFAWSSNGHWLATSGADTAVIWPFKGKSGPMGQEPLMMAERKGEIISSIASHPSQPAFAFGYTDGAVVVGNTRTGETRAILPPGEEDDDQTHSEITCLIFSPRGDKLVVGTEQGAAALVTL